MTPSLVIHQTTYKLRNKTRTAVLLSDDSDSNPDLAVLGWNSAPETPRQLLTWLLQDYNEGVLKQASHAALEQIITRARELQRPIQIQGETLPWESIAGLVETYVHDD